MVAFGLPEISAKLGWKNAPLDWTVEAQGTLSITAGAATDWFIDPAGKVHTTNAPAALFTPPDEDFLLSARVEVDFASTFDAGVLFVYGGNDLWAKLCFEYAPQGQPMIVSVVTRGASDDCNSALIDGRTVYLRLARAVDAIAFHYSQDGRYWHLVRYFSLGKMDTLEVGFLAQSPLGQQCRAAFSEIRYRPGKLSDIRSGE